MVFVAAGNIQHDDLVETVERCFGRAPAGAPLPSAAFPRSFSGSTLINRPTEQVQMVLGFPAPSITDARYYIAHLAAMLLGGGPISRLFQSIREERGLAYAVAADFMPYQNTGCFRVYTGTSRSRIKPVLDLVLRELHRLKTEPISPDDLRRVKKQLIGNQVIGMETSASRANALGSQLLALGHPVSLEERQARIEGVSEDQVMLLANALIDPSRLVVALVGDLQGLEVAPERLTC